MVIDNKYEIGQTVFLITDEDQKPRLVVAIKVCPGEIVYEVINGTLTSYHYDFEMSKEKVIQLN